MKRNKRYRKNKAIIRICRLLSIGVVCTCMVTGLITGSLFFLRANTSQLEKRELTAFPALSWNTFWDGSFFNDISLWYSDTYPGRDSLVSMANSMQKLYGFQPETMVIATGSGDDLQEEGRVTTGFSERHEAPKDLVVTVQDQVFQGMIVKDGAAYGGYYFIQEAFDAYMNLTKRLADELEGTTKIYSIIVPNNSGVLLDEQTCSQLGGADQKEAIDYYYSSLDERIQPVGTFQALKEHDDEYLYFRTDHHWTPLGAYYVYDSFANVKGWDPIRLEDLEEVSFEPFYGSYSTELAGVDLQADTFTCWVPNSWNSLQIYTDESEYGNTEAVNTLSWPIVNTNPEAFDERNHYLRLIYGDQGFEMIDNPKIQDGSSALVIKESYGNAFVPWITNHYDKVYVVDFRYNNMKLLSWIKQQQIDDLILINNMQLLANANVVYAYEELLQ